MRREEKRREEMREKRRFSTLEKNLSQQAVDSVALIEESFNDKSRNATKMGQRGETKA